MPRKRKVTPRTPRRLRREREADRPLPGTRPARSRREALTTAGLIATGLILIAVPLIFALRWLDIDAPKREEPLSFGFVPPRDLETENGFALGLLVEVHGCDTPVTVTAVLGGTAEYWVENHGRLAKWARFQLAAPDASPDVEIGLGHHATDVITMRDTRGLELGHAAGLATADLHIRPLEKEGELRIISGTVKNWEDRLAPLIVRYQADWLHHRGLGSCYLRLPAITGDLAVLSAQRARGAWQDGTHLEGGRKDLAVSSVARNRVARYDPHLELVLGNTTIVTERAEVATGDSLPQPDTSVNGSPTWTCGTVRKTTLPTERASKDHPPDFLVGADEHGAGALSERAITEGSGRDCSALAVIVETGANRDRDLMLLLVGAAMSLGFALSVELLIEVLRDIARPQG